MPITLTESAAKEIRSIIKDQGLPEDNTRLRVGVKGDRDPGYGSTSKMITEAAVCLLQDAKDTAGGIWTTAPAMGDRLIARLQANAGLDFAVETH